MKSSLFSGPCTCCFLGVPRKLFLHSSQRRAGCEGPMPRDSRCGVAWGGHAAIPFCYRVRLVDEKGRQTRPLHQLKGRGQAQEHTGWACSCWLVRKQGEERPLCCRGKLGVSPSLWNHDCWNAEDPCYLEPESSGLTECMGTLSWPVPFSLLDSSEHQGQSWGKTSMKAHISLLLSPGALVKSDAIW